MIRLDDIISDQLLESLSSVTTTQDLDMESTIAKHIDGIGVKVPSKLITEDGVVDVEVSYVFNLDDIYVERSSKIIYVYLNASKLDFTIPQDKLRTSPNTSDIKFLCVHPKAWFGDNQLYLMKINVTTGTVHVFDTEKDKFFRVTDPEVTYNDTSMKWVSLVLTPEYLQKYLSTELSLLCCNNLLDNGVPTRS